MSGPYEPPKNVGNKRSALRVGAFVGAVLLIGVLTQQNDTDSTPTPTSTSTTTSTSPTWPQPASISPWTTPSASLAPPAPALSGSQADGVASAGALAKLATIPIKGRAPKTGYDRSQFGDAWSDDVTVEFGHNGCDTRNDILRRDLTAVEIKPGSNGCAVLRGTLRDPYSDTTIEFQRGATTASPVEIDHVVALSDAWQKGAQEWDAVKRRNFANDPLELQATIGSINRQKGDGDAATWLPPNKFYRCTYVSRIVDIKAEYGLWVTQAEHDAIARVLTDCGAPGAATSPTTDAEPTTTESPVAPPAPESSPPEYVPPPPSLPPDTGSSVYYPDCKSAKRAGAAPLYRGQPGYREDLDGDGDGVACER